MLKEFKEFAMKGNVMDMAVGVIMGGAFGKIATSLVNDILMPPLGMLLGRMDFSNLFINLSGKPVSSLHEAKAAGVPTIAYGAFLNTIFDFIIVSFAMFLVIRQVNQLAGKAHQLEKDRQGPVTVKQCPYCISTIPVEAKRCPACTSRLKK